MFEEDVAEEEQPPAFILRAALQCHIQRNSETGEAAQALSQSRSSDPRAPREDAKEVARSTPQSGCMVQAGAMVVKRT